MISSLRNALTSKSLEQEIEELKHWMPYTYAHYDRNARRRWAQARLIEARLSSRYKFREKQLTA